MPTQVKEETERILDKVFGYQKESEKQDSTVKYEDIPGNTWLEKLAHVYQEAVQKFGDSIPGSNKAGQDVLGQKVLDELKAIAPHIRKGSKKFQRYKPNQVKDKILEHMVGRSHHLHEAKDYDIKTIVNFLKKEIKEGHYRT